MEYKLKELFDLQMGKTPSRNNSDYWNTKDNKWISIADLSKCEKYITDTKEYISDIAIKESGINPIPANTVVMSFKLSIGKTAITKEVIYSNEAIMSFRDKKTIELLPDYTYYLMMSKRWDEGTNKAVMGKTLNKATLSEIKVSVHDIVEQQRIVNILDKLTALIDKRKQQLEKLDELVKARFVEMFGDIHKSTKWEKKPWAELVTIQNGRDYKNIIVESGGYPVYGTGGEMARASDYLCPENTIIIGRKGTINNPLLVQEKFWNVDTAFGVMVGNKLHYQYFYNFCRMFDFSTLNKQAVLPSTTKADLLKIKMAVPPLALQNQFADFVKQVDKSKFEIKQSLEKLELLKKALMQKYFG